MTQDKESLKAYIKRLKAERDRYKEALAFYIDDDKYCFCSCGQYLASLDSPCRKCGGTQQAVLDDRGSVAREALKETE